MVKYFTADDIRLLGYSEVSEIELREKDAQFQIHSAELKAGLKKIVSKFVYLKSGCTKSDLIILKSYLNKNDDLYIITPPSVKLTQDAIKDILGNKVPIFSHEQIIWDKIVDTFSEYLTSLKEDSWGIARDNYFVAPRAENLSPNDRLDKEIMEYFSKAIQAEGRDIIVVSASAGVGKTTLARKLVLDLAKTFNTYKLIPIYVEAKHWDKLKLDTVSELWDIIDNSIHNYSHSNLTSDLFYHVLKEGYLVFVFDGFDELCGQKNTQFNAQEEIDRLASIATNSDAKIMITTRSLYWENAISKSPKNVKLYNLSPFNTQQAKDYFDKKFKFERDKYSKACEIYSQLIASNNPRNDGGSREQFVNLPLVVGMVGTFVDQGGLKLSTTGDVITDLMFQMCEREIIRKGLTTNTKRQFKAFEDLAVLKMEESNPTFCLDDFGMTDFDPIDIPKLVDHFLLDKSGDYYTFAFDFYPQYLRASFLTEKLMIGEVSNKDAWRLMSQESNGKSYILEHMLPMLGADITEMIKLWYANVPIEHVDSKSFLFHLAKSFVGKEESVMLERTNRLFTIFYPNFLKDRIIRNANFIGQLDKLDLSGISFIGCNFRDVSFSKCRADENTKFINCRFSGMLEFPGCAIKEWSQVQMIDTITLSPANLIWEEMLEEGKFFPRKEDHVKDALKLALNKFWFSGRLKATLRKDDWNKGTLGHSFYCKPVLDAMLKTGFIMEIEISNVPEGGYSCNHDSVEDLQRFMDNGMITGKIKEVFDLLLKK